VLCDPPRRGIGDIHRPFWVSPTLRPELVVVSSWNQFSGKDREGQPQPVSQRVVATKRTFARIFEELTMLGKLVAEFIGTFFLVLTIGQTVKTPDAAALAPLAIGAVLMVMVYATGHISGGHLNPAVTLGVWMRGKCPTSDVPGYMIAQFLAGAAAAAVVLFLKGSTTAPATAPVANEYALVAKIIPEFLFTFALVYVVLNTATAKGTAGNSFYGLAIGFTVLAGAFAVGPISGAAFNPAVAVGATIMGLIPPANVWIHLVGDFLGGAAAALVFNAFDMGGDTSVA
jgi:aquaporin Z